LLPLLSLQNARPMCSSLIVLYPCRRDCPPACTVQVVRLDSDLSDKKNEDVGPLDFSPPRFFSPALHLYQRYIVVVFWEG